MTVDAKNININNNNDENPSILIRPKDLMADDSWLWDEVDTRAFHKETTSNNMLVAGTENDSTWRQECKQQQPSLPSTAPPTLQNSVL